MCTYIYIYKDPVRRRHNRTHADWQVICDRISERFTPQMVTSVMKMNYKMNYKMTVNAPCHCHCIVNIHGARFSKFAKDQKSMRDCQQALFIHSNPRKSRKGNFPIISPQACPPSPWWEAMAGDAAPPPLPGSCFSALFTLALSVVTN